MEDAARRHGGRPELGPAGGGVDLISALPEDLLLQVLVRLRCARAAARTSLLSRRWRGLWICLPDLTFRDVALGSLLPVLASVEAAVGPGPAGVFLLDIRVPAARLFPGDKIDLAQLNERISSLFHTASRISPVELRLALPRIVEVHVDLPRFHRATSIELQAPSLRLTRPPRARGGFPALKRLSLSHCRVDLADFVPHCPCLRVLSVSNAGLDADNITVRSESLEELAVVNPYRWDDRIDIEAPMLKQLTLSFCTGTKLSVSIMAPILEKVSWGCFYSVVPVGLGPWGLWKVSLHAAESHGQRVLADTGEDACLQLSNVYVLSLRIWAYGLDRYPDAELNFAQEIEKHLVTDFSVLELHFMTMGPEYRIRSVGHVFGAFVVHLLGMHQIRTATRKLKVILQRSEMIKEECPVNCPCDVPNNWRSKNISLINLEEVEIEGFDGEDHEFDFLKVMFRCAPMLKGMAVRMSDEVRTSEDQCLKIYDIFQAYPFVECNVDLSSGSKHNNQSCASA